MVTPADLFDLSQTEHGALFEGCAHAWEVLPKIKIYLAAKLKQPPTAAGRAEVSPDAVLGRNVTMGEGVRIGPSVVIGDDVWIGAGTVVEDGIRIKGPAFIGARCEIRHGAYFRGHVILGDECVVGNSTELKNVLFFNRAVAPHFNYVGDSILGYRAHLGAGVKISNVKLVKGNVAVLVDGRLLDSGLRKFGAILGDRVEIGCNAVLNPGTLIGRDAVVYPNVNWRGALAAGMVAKNKAVIAVVPRRSP